MREDHNTMEKFADTSKISRPVRGYCLVVRQKLNYVILCIFVFFLKTLKSGTLYDERRIDSGEN
jgi:hypothetical protein